MTNALDAATFEHILTMSEPTTPATAMEVVKAIRAMAQARCAAHLEARAADSEARTDAWSEFEDAHLTDGNDGYRPLAVYGRCRDAFNGAWPKGRDEALRAARRALDPERTIRSADHLFDLIAGSLFDHPHKSGTPAAAVRLLADDLWELFEAGGLQDGVAQVESVMRVVPRKPTDRDIAEILYNINRKRRAADELTEDDVREVMDNYFYNVGKPGPAAAALG